MISKIDFFFHILFDNIVVSSSLLGFGKLCYGVFPALFAMRCFPSVPASVVVDALWCDRKYALARNCMSLFDKLSLYSRFIHIVNANQHHPFLHTKSPYIDG